MTPGAAKKLAPHLGLDWVELYISHQIASAMGKSWGLKQDDPQVSPEFTNTDKDSVDAAFEAGMKIRELIETEPLDSYQREVASSIFAGLMGGVYKAMAERYRNMARKYESWGVEFAAWDSTIEDHIRQPLQQSLQEAIPMPSVSSTPLDSSSVKPGAPMA